MGCFLLLRLSCKCVKPSGRAPMLKPLSCGARVRAGRSSLSSTLRGMERKMRSTTWECCTRVSMCMIETAPFCTSLLERLLNVQTGLEESVHGSLRRLLTEAYEASAGLSDNESPSVRGPPIAPDALRLRTKLFEASAGLSQNESPRVRGPPVVRRPPPRACPRCRSY